MRVLLLVSLILLAGCGPDRVLPGVMFGPQGRLMPVDASGLRHQVTLRVSNAIAARLPMAWQATVVIRELPTEDPDASPAERWLWDSMTVAVLLEGPDTNVPLSNDGVANIVGGQVEDYLRDATALTVQVAIGDPIAPEPAPAPANAEVEPPVPAP